MNKTRPCQFSFHATPEEAVLIRNNATGAVLSLQKFLLTYAKKECINLEDVEAFTFPIISELHSIGNNINQIAASKNSVRTWSRTDLTMNLDALESVIAEVRRVMCLSKEDLS